MRGGRHGTVAGAAPMGGRGTYPSGSDRAREAAREGDGRRARRRAEGRGGGGREGVGEAGVCVRGGRDGTGCSTLPAFQRIILHNARAGQHQLIKRIFCNTNIKAEEQTRQKRARKTKHAEIIQRRIK